MTGRIARLAALAATLSATLVCALPSAHAAAPPTPITGFADVHVHQFANLGFGGLVVWGQSFTPDGSIETALPWDDWTPGHFGDVVDKNGNAGRHDAPARILLFPSKCVRHSEVLGADCAPGTGVDILHHCDGFAVHGAGGLGDLVNAFSTGSLGHHVGGYPEFDGWPRYNNVTSQAVYYDWLKRAYDGGLRLMVMLAVNNEVLCKAGNHIARLRLRRHARRRPPDPGRQRSRGVRRRAERRPRPGLVSHRHHAAAGAPGDRRGQARRRARHRGRLRSSAATSTRPARRTTSTSSSTTTTTSASATSSPSI